MLALRLYFWDDWPTGTPAPAPAPAPSNLANAGGGGRKKRNNDYQGLDADFWEVRAKYLKRFVEPAQKTIVKDAPIAESYQESDALPSLDPAILLRQAFDAAANKAAQAQSMLELRALSDRLRAISLDISRIEQENYDRAMALLLLDVF